MRTVGDGEELDDVSVHAVDVGGIDETSVELAPGVTVLSGRNATNRSSFLTAVMAALGSDAGSLKADADAGAVELSIGDESYTRRFERTGDGVRRSGDPYCTDSTLADLFAFLVEANEARRTVERLDGDASADLRDVLMRPVDTESIEAEIERLRQERSEVDAELEHVEDLAGRLPELERRKEDLDDRLADAREELADVEAAIRDVEGSLDGPRDAADELEERLEALREAQNELEDARYDLETERESLAELREERSDLEAELDALDPVPRDRLADLEDRIERLRSERSSLESEINELQSVIGFNEDMLRDRRDLFEAESEDVTEQLVAGEETVSCWTCGSTVSVEEVQVTLDHLRRRRQRKVEERGSLGDELDELESRRAELERRSRRRTELERNLDAVEAEIERVRDRIEAQRETVAEREERVAELEAAVETLEAAADDHDELIELHREAQELAVEVDRLESERGDLAERVAEVEREVGRRDELERRREEIAASIEECRTRVDRLERAAVEAFNDHVAEVLDVLDYDNVERVWLERGAESDGTATEQRTFRHHVVRTAPDGTTYEDSVDNLSESEREVIGLVVALAGYLVHDVHETVPFVVLDSLEAIDAERIAALVDYFASYADYLLVALLPEDAAALDDDYHYVTDV